jgi:uncharacterized membrane protein
MSKPKEAGVNERIKRNIESIAQLEQTFNRRRTFPEWVSDAVTAFAGSFRFVFANAIVIIGWILWNHLARREERFDPSLNTLQLLIASEAILLSAFVLMSQNRQNRQADHWAHVELQISMLAEQENTKILEMLRNISHALGMKKTAGDAELKELSEQLPVATLVEEVGKARQTDEIAAVLAEQKETNHRGTENTEERHTENTQ